VSHSCTRRSLLNDLRWDNARKGVPEGEAPQGAESSHPLRHRDSLST